jgi:uncharacterized membrane-anchored protein YhcB (DUF1043 family)
MTKIEITFFLIGMIIGMITTLIIHDLAIRNANKQEKLTTKKKTNE